MTAIRILLAAALLALAAPATAQPYLFVTPGQARAEGKNMEATFIGTGYHLTRHFAVEASYLRAEHVVAHVQQGMNITAITQRVSGIALSAVGRLHLSESFAFLAKVGARNLKHVARTETISTILTAEVREWVPTIAAGAQYMFLPQFSAMLMLERSEARGNVPSVELVSLGISYSF